MFLAVFMGPGPGIAPSDEHAVIDLCIEQAVACANARFSLVTFGEQHFNGYEPYCNPFMIGARIAPLMKETYLGTTVCPLPFHHPLRLAENINVLDVMTRGKLIAGLSAGRPSSGPNMPSDFESFAVSPDDRERLFESKLDIMLKAWAHRRDQPPLTIDTPWDKGVLRGQLMPQAFREGRPLFAIGANSDASILRAAKLAVPLFLGPCPRSEAAAKFVLYREALEKSVPSSDAVQSLVNMSLVARTVIMGETDADAWNLAESLVGNMVNRRGDNRSLYDLSLLSLDAPEVRADPLFGAIRFVHSGLTCGSPESVVEQLKFYPEHGIPQVHIRFPVTSPLRLDAVWRSFNLFVNEVMPKLDPQTFPAPTRALATREKPGGEMPFERSAPGRG